MTEKALVEAALFLSGKALSKERLIEILGPDSSERIDALVNELSEEYKARNSGIEVLNLGGKYKIHVKSEYASKIQDSGQATDLSKSELKTLAYVVFKQPVRQSQIVQYRGSGAYDHIKHLIELKFLGGERERNTLVLNAGPSFQEYFGTDAVTLQRKILSKDTPVSEAEGITELVKELAEGLGYTPRDDEQPEAPAPQVETSSVQ